MAIRSPIHSIYKPVRDQQRIGIPSDFSKAAKLVAQTKPVSLWMVRHGRYRLLIGDDANHPEVLELRTRISERDGAAQATEFDDNALTVMSARLMETELSSGKEWRLTLPDLIMDILKIRKEEQAVVVLDGRFIEIWSVETFEATFKIPTSEMFH